MENNSNFYKNDTDNSQLDNNNSNVAATTSNQNSSQNYSNKYRENYHNFQPIHHLTQKEKNRMRQNDLNWQMNVYSRLRESAEDWIKKNIKKVNAMSFWLIGLTLGYITFVILSIYYGFSLFENTNNWIILTAMIVVALVFIIAQTIILGILKKRLEYYFSTKGYRFAIGSSGLILFGTVFSALFDFFAGDGGLFMMILIIIFIVFFAVFFTLSAISALFMPFIVASFIIKKLKTVRN